MKKYAYALFFACIVTVGMSAPFSAYAQDTKQARTEAAIAYEKVTPVSELVGAMIDEMKKSPALQKLSAEDFEAIRASYDMDGMRSAMIDAMVKNFTTAEIDALTAFYSTPEGRSVMKKFPVYMTDMMPAIQKQTQVAMQNVFIAKQKAQQKSAPDQ